MEKSTNLFSAVAVILFTFHYASKTYVITSPISRPTRSVASLILTGRGAEVPYLGLP